MSGIHLPVATRASSVCLVPGHARARVADAAGMLCLVLPLVLLQAAQRAVLAGHHCGTPHDCTLPAARGSTRAAPTNRMYDKCKRLLRPRVLVPSGLISRAECSFVVPLLVLLRNDVDISRCQQPAAPGAPLLAIHAQRDLVPERLTHYPTQPSQLPARTVHAQTTTRAHCTTPHYRIQLPFSGSVIVVEMCVHHFLHGENMQRFFFVDIEQLLQGHIRFYELLVALVV